ncbi:MAG: PD40 domain-containing protein [Thermoflexales bacterium]|nr:PD40 domain-containing protein [Thermoflexales bacterium]
MKDHAHYSIVRFASIIIVITVLLTACSSNQITYQVSGTAKQAEVSYTDSSGKSQTATVDLPWEISYKVGSPAKFSLSARNTGSQGSLACVVLLNGKELGSVKDARQYVSCEGQVRQSGSSTNIDFHSSQDVLPGGISALPATPTPPPAAPRTNGGGSGLAAFKGVHKSAKQELFLLRFDGSQAEVVPLTEGAGVIGSPIWSPDGAKLLFIRQQGTGKAKVAGMYVLDMDGLQMTRLVDQLELGVDTLYTPAWSPDGSQILFSGKRQDKGEIYVAPFRNGTPFLNSAGTSTNVIDLSSHATDDWEPCWSPDGKTIYFHSERKGDRQGEIYAMDADGTNVRQLTDLGGGVMGGIDVSPDGRRLAFYRDSDIYVVNTDGTGQANLTDDKARDYFPAWSPDGSKIAFESDRSPEKSSSGAAQSDIYVMDADGSNATRLTTDIDNDNSPRWSLDGHLITFVSKRENRSELYIVGADGTGETRLTEDNNWNTSHLFWQPASASTALARLPDTPVRFAEPAASASPTPVPLELTAKDHAEQGILYYGQGQYEQAIAEFEQAVKFEPDHAPHHRNLGTALMKQNKYQTALAAYQQAVQLNPSYGEAYGDMVGAYIGLGQLEEAVKAGGQAIKLAPAYATGHNNLGLAYYRQGKLDEAITQYQEALRLNPSDVLAYLNLGVTYRDKGEYDKAILVFEEYLRKWPNATNKDAVEEELTKLKAKGN